jgi:hypothetical protein
MYLRHNGTQEFLGDLRDISQPTVSRIVTTLVPIVKAVLEEFVPTPKDAIETVKGRVCLVDGTITPCWSYADHDELWSRKHGTTGFNARNWSGRRDGVRCGHAVSGSQGRPSASATRDSKKSTPCLAAVAR